MESYCIRSHGLYKIVHNFIMTNPETETVRQSNAHNHIVNVQSDPSNMQIFNFLSRSIEIHWCERTHDFATVYFKATANQKPEYFPREGRQTYTHSFLRVTVIDPIMWQYPVEGGRGFIAELLEDIRTRWNMQLKAHRRMFKNTDSLIHSPHLEQTKP